MATGGARSDGPNTEKRDCHALNLLFTRYEAYELEKKENKSIFRHELKFLAVVLFFFFFK